MFIRNARIFPNPNCSPWPVDDSGLLRLFAVLVSSVLVVTAAALLLAELERFSLPGVLIGAGLLAGPVTLAARKFQVAGSHSETAPRRSFFDFHFGKFDTADRLALLVLVVAAVLFFRPFEDILGGRDGGVYVNTGVNLAHTGRLWIPDPFFAGLPPTVKDKLTWVFPGTEIQELRFKYPGYFWVDAEQQVIPQFTHAYSIWIGLIYSLAGIATSLYLTPAIAWLSLLAVYLAGRELFNAPAGLLGMVFLMINPSQIWFSRYPNADVGFQLFFLGGLVFWTRWVKHKRWPDAVLAGVIFGSTLFFKLDATFLIAPIALVTALAWLRDRDRAWAAFALPWLLVSGWGIFHGVTFSRPYVLMSFGFVLRYMPLVILGSGMVLPALLLAARRAKKFDPVANSSFHQEKWQPYLTRSLAALLLLTAAYLYLVPPLGFSPLAGVDRLLTGLPDPVQPNMLQELGWYLTPLGLALSLAGAAWLTTHCRNAATGLLLLSVLVYLLINLRLITMANSDHIWAIRRHISVVMPAMALLAAYLLTRLSSRQRLGRAAPVIALGLALLVAGRSVQLDWPLLHHTEFKGAIAEAQQLADTFPPDALVLMDGSWAGNYLSLPLNFIHRRPVLAFWPQQGEPAYETSVIEAVSQAGLQAGYGMYFLASTSRPPESSLFAFEPVMSFHWTFPKMEQAHDHLPQTVESWDVPYYIYHVIPR